MNKDDMSDDAEFDAFLNGEGDLARCMQGLAQPGPSAALDATILSHARDSMAHQARPVAANDSGDSAPATRLAPGLGRRWRIPAAIAATVLAGVFANQTFQSAGDLNEVVMPAPASETVFTAPVPEPQNDKAAVTQDQASAPATIIPLAPAPAQRRPRQAEAAKPTVAKPGVAKPMPVIAQSAPPAAEAEAAPAAAPAPPPVANRENAKSSNERRLDATQAKALAPSADEWLNWIEKLLEQGNKKMAMEQWEAFRAAYPDHPVPAQTREKLE